MRLKKNAMGSWFFLIAIGSLFLGLLFGVLGCFQYLFPGFLKDTFSFQKMRPLHTYLCINWIFCAAIGAIYYYVPTVSGKKLYAPILAKLHVAMQLLILGIVVIGFCFGVFGGREYFEFPPYIGWLIITAWIIFMINFFATIRTSFYTSPVYIWSWCTGLVFFLITFLEAQLWQFSFFNNNIIRDVTVQWKAMGAMVGSWNMLVYGTAMFAMEKITGNTTINKSKTAFFFYFLGLTNLMFNWGHHTYIVPSSHWVKTISYAISMTELLILANIIYSFRRTYLKNTPRVHPFSFKILTYAEVWILVNLVLSITISVPAINYYTHGTHITVAHAMGSTIGINTLLLLASLTIIADDLQWGGLRTKPLSSALTFFNLSLFVFWVSLIGMGLTKIAYALNDKGFYEIMSRMMPYFKIFTASGAVLVIALLCILIPLFKIFLTAGLQHYPEKQTTNSNISPPPRSSVLR